MSAIDLIKAERETQIELGYTCDNDDLHTQAELAKASMAYIDYVVNGSATDASKLWPFTPESFKPSGNNVKDLTKAGALIFAELERQLRCQ